MAVVVVTHNRPQLLTEALAALRGQTHPPRHVIVVDNASGVETRGVLETAAVTVVRSEVNVGGAGGFVLGMRRALDLGASWIWLMDDDAIPAPTALEALISQLPGLPANTGAVCGSVIEFGSLATTHRRTFSNFWGFERPVPAWEYGGNPLEIHTASFVGFLVSASAVRAVGLPRSEFYLGYDDTEYSLRLRKSGYTVWLAPASVVLHKRLQSARMRVSSFGPKHYFNVRNRIALKREHCVAGRLAAASGALMGIALCLRCPSRLRPSAWRVLMWAVADGFLQRLGPLPNRVREATAE